MASHGDSISPISSRLPENVGEVEGESKGIEVREEEVSEKVEERGDEKQEEVENEPNVEVRKPRTARRPFTPTQIEIDDFFRCICSIVHGARIVLPVRALWRNISQKILIVIDLVLHGVWIIVLWDPKNAKKTCNQCWYSMTATRRRSMRWEWNKKE